MPYLRLLSQDAFSTYATIAHDVTLSPSMGHYLDMVNNDKPNPALGRSADENYARELLQLFTIGVNELNDDGSPRLENGQPVPTYSQDTIEYLSNVLTGWTYPPKPGAVSASHNPAWFQGQMVPVQSNHDTSAKVLLDGATLPADQTAQQDLDGALQIILSHRNVAPFVSRQLIQHLVTSAPSPAYVARVASAFRVSGGDMKTVIRAILLDPEARAGDDAIRTARENANRLALRAPDAEAGRDDPGFGHLREPALFINGLLRSLGAVVPPTNGLPSQSNILSQNVYY